MPEGFENMGVTEDEFHAMSAEQQEALIAEKAGQKQVEDDEESR